jgi:hypothetical protein
VRSLERPIEHKCCAYVEKEYQGIALKLHVKGWPDRLILIPRGIIFFVEFKAPGERPRKLQKYIHALIASLGFNVYVVDDIEEFKRIVDREHEIYT